MTNHFRKAAALTLAATLAASAASFAAPVANIKVQPDKAPDCTSLKSIVETVTRDCKEPAPSCNDQPPGAFVWRAHGLVDSEPAAVWDPVHRAFLAWGGHFLDVGHEQNDDIWAFDPEAPGWRSVPQVNGPRANCCATQLGFDARRGELLVFGDDGGQSHGWIPVTVQGYNRSLPMAYDHGTQRWTALRPWPVPPGGARQHKGFIHHPGLDRHVLYGGRDTAPGTWLYDRHRNEWSELAVENLPGRQYGCLLAVHPDSGEVLLWGRDGEQGSALFALAVPERRWRRVAAADPPPWLYQAALVFDPHADAFVLLGVRSVAGRPDALQVWRLGRDLAAWQAVPLPESGEVPGRERPISALGFTAAYAPEANLYLLMGGTFGAQRCHAWTWRLAATRALPPPGPALRPPPRAEPPAPAAPTAVPLPPEAVRLDLPPLRPGSQGFLVERSGVATRRFVSRFQHVQTELVFTDFACVTPQPVAGGTWTDRVQLADPPAERRCEAPPNPIAVEYAQDLAPSERWQPLAVHAYRLREVGGGGTSGPSPWVLTLPPQPDTPAVTAPPPDDPRNGIVTLSWPAPAVEGIVGYRIYRQLSKCLGPDWMPPWTEPYHLDPHWQLLGTAPAGAGRFEDASIPGGNGLRRYYVSAVDRHGQEGPPSTGAWAYRPMSYDEPPPAGRTPALFVPELPGAVAVDGVLDEPVWTRATRIAFGFLDGRRAPPTQATTAYVFTSGGTLYIGADCREERMDELSVHRDWRHDNTFLWKDDTFEVTLVPEPGERPRLHHVMISPANVVHDAWGEAGALDRKAWNPPLRSAVTEKPDGWRVELALPLAELRGPDPLPAMWRANLLRNRQQTAHRTLEETAWAPPMSCRPHLLSRLGRLSFQCLGAQPPATVTP